MFYYQITRVAGEIHVQQTFFTAMYTIVFQLKTVLYGKFNVGTTINM